MTRLIVGVVYYAVIKNVLVPAAKGIRDGVQEGLEEIRHERYLSRIEMERQNPLKG